MSGNGDGRPPGDAEQQRLDSQARELIALFEKHDRFGLGQLSPTERDKQLDARAALADYMGWLYTQLKKEQGLDPKYDPDLAILSAYRNLIGALGDTAVDVSAELGNDRAHTEGEIRPGDDSG